MRQYRAGVEGRAHQQGTSIVDLYSADCIINMSASELRQAQAKRAAIRVGRYTHAHQFKRARRKLKLLRTRLGRIIDGAASSGYDGTFDTSPCQPSRLSVQNGLRKHAMRSLCHIDHLSHADIGREAAQRVGVLF
jgi:hypothetical protein